MRIALFGGTFDPPHRGHMAIAQAALDAFQLDRVLFAPTGRQPLKLNNHSTPFPDRMAMVTAACEEANRNTTSASPRLFVTDIDSPRPDRTPNYTIDTLTTLHALYPQDELFNLVGADSFLTLPRWRSPIRLIELAQWIVVARPGYTLSDLQLTPLSLTPVQRDRIHLLTDIHEDVSATSLRKRLRHDDPCADLLSPAVIACIAERGLYKLPPQPTL